MSNSTNDKALKNFAKVALRSFVRPTRLITGTLSVVTAIAVPQISIPVLIAGGISIVGMSWADINNPDFIAKVLSPKISKDYSYTTRLKKQIEILKKIKSDSSIYIEVQIDIDESIETLNKIIQVIQILPKDDQGSIAFVVDQVEKLINRLIKLLSKEQLARKYLQNEDKHEIEKELKALQSNLENIKDKVARRQIEKVIKQKIQQIDNHNQVEHRLTRIDAYIANIRAALFTTYSNLTKLQLRDEGSIIDEADLLTESMKQIVDEIDAFEEMSIDINTIEDKNSKRNKETQKI